MTNSSNMAVDVVRLKWKDITQQIDRSSGRLGHFGLFAIFLTNVLI